VSPTELIVEIPLSTERLRLAVAGLGGIAGALLVPVVSSWLGLLMQLLEGDSSGLGPALGPAAGSPGSPRSRRCC